MNRRHQVLAWPTLALMSFVWASSGKLSQTPCQRGSKFR